MRKRIFCVILCGIMLLSALPCPIAAVSEDLEKVTVSVSSPPDSLSADELFSQYALQTLYGSGICPCGAAAGDALTEGERILYDALFPLLRQIASGQRASTTLSVGRDVTDQNGTFYPADVPATFHDVVLAPDSLQRVVAALISDLPYELYWYDKVTGCKIYYLSTSEAILQFGFRFHVADNYQGDDTFSVDTAKTGIPSAAAAYAASIAASFASASDYQKLLGYKNAICELVDYNYDALHIDFSSQADPWQIIYVFDQDPETKVVCEGYAKAFQYLCDLSVFQSDIACVSIPGYMNGKGHMWNIVSIGGKNYLADLTNSDHGSSGFYDHLFLAGGPGSISEGYLVGNSHYTYDPVCTLIWGNGADSLLRLADTSYSQETPPPETQPTETAPSETQPTETTPSETQPPVQTPSVSRIFGSDRYATAFQAADTLLEMLGIEKFSCIIVACGTNFPDALAGTYLAARKSAPILLVKGSNVAQVNAYIQSNLAQDGTVYLLGGTSVVPDSIGRSIPGITVKRLGGANRYDTNLQILREAGVTTEDIVICTGQNFADSLSVSAVGLPILLVKDGLTAAQMDFLAATSGRKIIIGGTAAVSNAVEMQLAACGSTTRLAGATRYETSILVAKAFFPEAEKAVLAYAQNFPDGLSGGPLAYHLGAPLILTATGKEAFAAAYTAEMGIHRGLVLGGSGLISNETASRIFGTE